MYPYLSDQALRLLQEEKLKDAQEQPALAAQISPLQQGTQSLAHLLGAALLTLGTRLERVGLEGR
jgi:hypothetical protein